MATFSHFLVLFPLLYPAHSSLPLQFLSALLEYIPTFDSNLILAYQLPCPLLPSSSNSRLHFHPTSNNPFSAPKQDNHICLLQSTFASKAQRTLKPFPSKAIFSKLPTSKLRSSKERNSTLERVSISKSATLPLQTVSLLYCIRSCVSLFFAFDTKHCHP